MTRRFAFRYWRSLVPLFVLLGIGPRRSWVELDDVELRVQMGIGFRARLSRHAIVAAARDDSPWRSAGIHGNLRKAWLVNAAARPVVWLDLQAPVRGRVYGFPVQVERLGLGLDDPDGFLAELGLA